MTASNNRMEVHCPVCHELFGSEQEMLSHYDAVHEKKGAAVVEGEEVAGAIYVSETSFFGGVNFYLLFTSNRLLAVKASPKVAKLVSPFIEDIPSMLVIGRHKTNRNKQRIGLTKALEKELMEGEKKNFELLFSKISKVELKRHGRFATGELSIITIDEKHLNYRLVMLPTARDDTFEIYENLLKSALPEKLTVIE